MPDPSGQGSVSGATRAEACDQIGRAVSSLWQRRSGVRPASVSTEYVGDVVRCQIEQGEGPEDAADADTEDAGVDALGARGYQLQAQAAVRRLTGRKVLAFVAKSEGEPATNAFILEARRVKN
jgi:hypothetical protein